jgi:hypothetical protein
LEINQGIMVDEDAIASIKTSGIIGDKYVSISIGAGDPLKDGGTISHTESSFVLEDAIGQLVNGGGSKSNSSGGDSSPAASPSPSQAKSGGDGIGPPPGAGAPKGQSQPNDKGQK